MSQRCGDREARPQGGDGSRRLPCPIALLGHDSPLEAYWLAPERTLSGHSAPTTSIDFSPDGRWLVTGGLDDAVLVSNLSDGEILDSNAYSRGGVVPRCIRWRRASHRDRRPRRSRDGARLRALQRRRRSRGRGNRENTEATLGRPAQALPDRRGESDCACATSPPLRERTDGLMDQPRVA